MNNQREQWGSKLGFIFAAAGSAVGIGNIWKFPSMAGENGGGAFTIVYLVCILIVGLSIVIAELVIGRNTQLSPVGAFEKIAPKSNWKWVGFLGVASAFVILSFYGVVGGWILKYVVDSLFGVFNNLSGNPDAAGATFDAFVRYLKEDPWERLARLRNALPNSKIQMLLRGQNLLGYRHYSDDVVEMFVKKSADNGVDVFRVFDALNDIRNLEVEISDTTDFILYNKNKSGLKEYGFNNKATVAKKVNAGKKMDLPGIMFWQLAGDLPVDSENSLLRVISTELGYKKDGSR